MALQKPNFSKKHRHLVKAFVCGTAIAAGQGCLREVDPVTSNEMTMVASNIKNGREQILPVVLELAEAADQNILFGFTGNGSKSFEESILDCDQKLSELVESGRIFKYNDPLDTAMMFFRARENEEKELIGINTAYISIFPFNEVFPDQDTQLYRDYYGYYIHEGCHNWQTHSSETKESAEDQNLTDSELYKSVLQEEKDFPYLAGFMLTDLENKFDKYYLNWKTWFDSYIEGTRNQMATDVEDGNDVETERKNLESFLNDASTPEGWTKMWISQSDDIFNSYLIVPTETETEIIAASGWYEGFVEKEMAERIIEVRREFGLKNETELNNGMGTERWMETKIR